MRCFADLKKMFLCSVACNVLFEQFVEMWWTIHTRAMCFTSILARIPNLQDANSETNQYMFSKIKQMLKFLALPLYVPPGNTIIRSNNKHKLRIIIPQDVMLNWQHMLRNQHQYGHDYHEKCDERRGIHGPRTQTKTQCTGGRQTAKRVVVNSNSDSQTWNQNKLWWFLVIPFIDYILHIACDEMTSREIVLDCSTRIELLA